MRGGLIEGTRYADGGLMNGVSARGRGERAILCNRRGRGWARLRVKGLQRTMSGRSRCRLLRHGVQLCDWEKAVSTTYVKAATGGRRPPPRSCA